MAIVGFNLKKILVERKDILRGEVKVSTKMNITNVEKQDIKITVGKEVLSFDFEFAIYYKGIANHIGDVADIVFEGNVLYLVDPKEAKEILDDWKKKEISPDIRIRILNTILAKCNVKALIFEEDLGLPPHLPLPRFTPKTKMKKEEEEKPKKK